MQMEPAPLPNLSRLTAGAAPAASGFDRTRPPARLNPPAPPPARLNSDNVVSPPSSPSSSSSSSSSESDDEWNIPYNMATRLSDAFFRSLAEFHPITSLEETDYHYNAHAHVVDVLGARWNGIAPPVMRRILDVGYSSIRRTRDDMHAATAEAVRRAQGLPNPAWDEDTTLSARTVFFRLLRELALNAAVARAAREEDDAGDGGATAPSEAPGAVLSTGHARLPCPSCPPCPP